MRRTAVTIMFVAMLIASGLTLLPGSAQPATAAAAAGGGIGTVAAWGQNSSGQCNVPAPNQDFTAIAAGGNHSLGLRSDGSLAAWGQNLSNQCSVPAPNSGFVAVAAGGSHSLGLKSDGSVAAWGLNINGQCNVPAPNSGFTAVAAGVIVAGQIDTTGRHSLGLRSDGSVAAWGLNINGQCNVPAPNSGFVAVAAGGAHSLGLKSDGSVAAWGLNSSGQCNVPAPNSGFTAVAAGGAHSLGLKSDGSVVCWGSNIYNQCNVPAPNSGFISLSGGAVNSLGLRSDGSISAWGDNSLGQLDVPAPNSGFVAIAAGAYHSLAIRASDHVKTWAAWADVPAPNSGFTRIEAGSGHGLALRTDGSVTAWGNNASGQLNVPAPNTGFTAVSGGFNNSLGLRSDGSVAAWGDNTYGQCNVPAPNSGFTAISAGNRHALGLKADGSVAAWGDNTYGQCNVPAPNSGFTAVAAGDWFSLGLKTDGSIAAWGDNTHGQLNVPAPNSGFTAVDAGWGFSLGLRSDGSIAAWGRNDEGQSTVPAPNSGFKAVAAGDWFSLGLRSDGSIAGWGYNPSGSFDVPAPNERCSAIAFGQSNGLAIQAAYPVNASVSGGGGMVSPATQTVGYGNDATIDITPDPGYCASSITDNGTPQAVSYPYVIGGVDTAHDVVVAFAPNTFTWYLPEGSTDGGMETWILLTNPNPAPVTVDLEFDTDSGAVAPPALAGLTVPALTRISCDVTSFVTTYDLSTRVIAHGSPVHCERATYGPGRAWGTTSAGSPGTATQWCAAEGSTDGGMQTYILVQNPNDTTADVTLKFLTGAGEVAGLQETLPAHTRATYRANDYLTSYDVATEVTSDNPVACERATYGNDWAWGTCSTATPFAWDMWFVPGMHTGNSAWLLVANPNATAATVDIKYYTGGAVVQGPVAGIPPRSRVTFNPADTVPNAYVSAMITATGAEVACDWSEYSSGWGWGISSAAAPFPTPQALLTEGSTDGGMNTFVTLFNPADTAVNADLTLYTGSGELAPPALQGVTVPAQGVLTVLLNDYVTSYDVSTLVDASGPVVVKRMTYCTDSGWCTATSPVFGVI